MVSVAAPADAAVLSVGGCGGLCVVSAGLRGGLFVVLAGGERINRLLLCGLPGDFVVLDHALVQGLGVVLGVLCALSEGAVVVDISEESVHSIGVGAIVGDPWWRRRGSCHSDAFQMRERGGCAGSNTQPLIFWLRPTFEYRIIF